MAAVENILNDIVTFRSILDDIEIPIGRLEMGILYLIA